MAVAPKAQGGRQRPCLSVPIAIAVIIGGLALGGRAPATDWPTGAHGAPVTRPALAGGSTLIRTAYSFVRDSGGGHTNPEKEVDLLFATDSKAYLYLARPSGLGEHGSYSYSGGRLSLHISTPDFTRNETFPSASPPAG